MAVVIVEVAQTLEVVDIPLSLVIPEAVFAVALFEVV